ncbi:TPA: 3'-5' exoribonuclease [Enterobacter hormaechei subsp. hoffmannii]|nr:3'-5' exoribonuclease [Enterobacter hormaechei subsp. hoffmannii]HED2690222.1 3'-5' exoribonuclease [Enterobacter hormaechei subsp. hoffmannii]HED2772423.1 3'-5' exoribonuclease [Enterobacter hormaechei subsp. hoffmannii]HED4154753.1 3'-5' exoribonuclease [Enterobacter hormaechei subsp. hoffmannii]HED4164502.1 3'-5' exoribonuclease [Enterobacter hormaechei subsp. hoffmannii]
MKHVTIDIEAMDNKPTAAIASIAAAIFDPMSGEVFASMYRAIAIESSEAFGGTLGAETIKWWFKQSGEVRAEVTKEGADSLPVALSELNMFILRNCDQASVKVWARGTDYDMPIIYNALRGVDLSPVWNFWNVRDVRTVEEVALTVCGYSSKRIVDFEKHNAAADVLNQIAQLSDNLKSLAAKHTTGAAL